jgi:hypothetical protein
MREKERKVRGMVDAVNVYSNYACRVAYQAVG